MSDHRIYMREEKDGQLLRPFLVWVGKKAEKPAALHAIGSALSYVGYRVEHPDGISQGSNVRGVIHLADDR